MLFLWESFVKKRFSFIQGFLYGVLYLCHAIMRKEIKNKIIMGYKVIYEVSGRKITLGRYTTKDGAEKRVASEKLKHNFGKNGYRESITVKMVK